MFLIVDGTKLNMLGVPYFHIPYSLSACETCRLENYMLKLWTDL